MEYRSLEREPTLQMIFPVDDFTLALFSKKLSGAYVSNAKRFIDKPVVETFVL